MEKFCGKDEIFSVPKEITINKVDGKFGTPYIYCDWKILITDPNQIIDLEFYNYVN